MAPDRAPEVTGPGLAGVEIPLTNLPDWSPWPSRLLGLTPWSVPSRTLEKVAAEYDEDKYAACRRFFEQADNHRTVEAVKRFESGESDSREICVSERGILKLTSLREARDYHGRLLPELMRAAIERATTVVELGCGYGYNLWTLSRCFPRQKFLGGEYSANAVSLAAELFCGDTAIEVQRFNYYDAQYELLAEASRTGPVVVFTSHSVEQLPSAVNVIERLADHRSTIESVFHFEPMLGLHGTSLLGLLRRRYVEANDYNRDLLELLRARRDIKLVLAVSDVMGLNPLNPTSVVQWCFTDE